MGKEKAGFLTPKAIANRIKAKGLQKLRWYCQMCQKQCRDENGFKCHMTSESHQRQLLLFAENPDQYIDEFSKEFLDGYVELLRRRFGTKRVNANIVYQEYISDREHVHMNSTQWETLTEFVKWLGREGHCTVDDTEKGWFVQYIDRDPETIRKQEQGKMKEKMDMDDEERTSKFIQQQIERAAKQETPRAETEYTELIRESEEEKVKFNLAISTKKKEETTTSMLKPPSGLTDNPITKSEDTKDKPEKKKRESRWDDGTSDGESSSGSQQPPVPPKRDPSKPGIAGQKRKSALDEIMQMEEAKKEKVNRKDYWLCKGIVVKVVLKKLGDKYYKKKAVVKDVQDLYSGIVKMLDSGDRIKIDQTHVETVLPAIGKPVIVVNGAYRGQEAILENINEKKFSCTISLRSGPLHGRVIENVQYEDISKLHIPS